MKAITSMSRDECDQMVRDWINIERGDNPDSTIDEIAAQLATDMLDLPDYLQLMVRHYLGDALSAVYRNHDQEPESKPKEITVWGAARKVAAISDDLRESRKSINLVRPRIRLVHEGTQPKEAAPKPKQKPASNHPWKAQNQLLFAGSGKE